ncbi:MAG: hypothetical protein OSA45_10315 [Halioglobus sp.]|nr:hypothetical protein [Halioglobus sp.]
MNQTIIRILPLVVVLASCSNGNNNDNFSAPTFSVDPETIDVSQAEYCDITQTEYCLFPFPNNFFTREDAATPTGKRVNFSPLGMPVNEMGVAIDPKEINRSDGFSIGSLILAFVDDIDLDATGAASIVDMAASMDADAPIQLIDAETGERQLIWAELDQNPQEGEPQALMLHAGKALQNGRRYIVVLQNLVDSSGNIIEPGAAFTVFREAIPSEVPELEARREHFESLFSSLTDVGIERNELYLTWDFTTVSTENTTNRVLHMRDTSLAGLSGAAPAVTINSVVDRTADEGESSGRVIEGTINVPNFLDTATAGPGSRLNFGSDDPDALPEQFEGDGTVEVPFVCNISQAAFDDAADGDTDSRAVIVGHGFLGDRFTGLGFGAQITNAIFCSMDFWGMSNQDVSIITDILGDLSHFPTMPDRLQQAFLNKIFLSEAIVNAGGFQALPEFQDDSGNALFTSGIVQYNGVSMGSVYGGTLTALSPHFDYSVLDLAGMNWGLIIPRSNIWDTFALLYKPSYPDPVMQPLGLALVQTMWDRADSNGYANHITRNPLPGSKLSRVLINAPIGDQILTETAAELMQRSLEVKRHNPSIVEGRHIAVEPYLDIEPITTYPHEGNVVMHWDSGPFPLNGRDGTPLQRLDNLPRNLGYDTHGMPMGQTRAWEQKAVFWRTGEVVNVCGAQPCFGDGYDGTPGVYDLANAP